MNKKLITIVATIMILFLSIVTVQAATGDVTLRATSETVKPGETFKVILAATSQESINGLDAKISYDNEKLELVSKSQMDSANWADLSVDNQITVLWNKPDTSTNSADIIEFTFKAKEVENSSATISIGETILSTNASENSNVNIGKRQISVKIEKVSSVPSTPTEPSEPSTPTEPSKPSNQTNNIKVDKLPKTGENQIILVAIILGLISVGILYTVCKKYKIV